MDKEEIKKALDHFENDEFTDAKEILQKQIKKAKDDYIDGKLGLGDKQPAGEKDTADVDDSDADD